MQILVCREEKKKKIRRANKTERTNERTKERREKEWINYVEQIGRDKADDVWNQITVAQSSNFMFVMTSTDDEHRRERRKR
jgi:anion-transporting  ArsA/GET3 family ATPase